MDEARVAVVTGASGGIGRALCRRFAETGMKVAAWDMMIPEDFVRELEGRGTGFLAETVDITDRDQVERGAKALVQRWGRIDVLVNNAGITRDGLLLRMSEEDWDAVLAVNLKGAFLCSKIIGKILFGQRSGRIVNIASVIGQTGNVGQGNYAASKAGLIALTKTAAREYARAGVTVNAVAPGYIRTPMTERLSDPVKAAVLERIPLGNLGCPEDVAGAVMFLVSPAASYITGQVLRVDGGLVM